MEATHLELLRLPGAFFLLSLHSHPFDPLSYAFCLDACFVNIMPLSLWLVFASDHLFQTLVFYADILGVFLISNVSFSSIPNACLSFGRRVVTMEIAATGGRFHLSSCIHSGARFSSFSSPLSAAMPRAVRRCSCAAHLLPGTQLLSSTPAFCAPHLPGGPGGVSLGFVVPPGVGNRRSPSTGLYPADLINWVKITGTLVSLSCLSRFLLSRPEFTF